MTLRNDFLFLKITAVLVSIIGSIKMSTGLENHYQIAYEEPSYYVIGSPENWIGRQGTDPGQYTCEYPTALCIVETNEFLYAVGTELRVNKYDYEIITQGTFTSHTSE